LDENVRIGKYIVSDRLVRLVHGICEGLKYIHNSKLAHRDLKTQNVLVSDNGQQAILTDFGSMTDLNIEIRTSRIAQEIEEWAAQNCSMFYKAPELFAPKIGSVINGKADIWSLGCLIFALMFNKGPFDYVAERGDSIALAVSNVKYSMPMNLVDRPEALTNIVKNTLIDVPEKRFDMTQILNQLNGISEFDLKEITLA
jgi:serine/threonine kinase 16